MAAPPQDGQASSASSSRATSSASPPTDDAGPTGPVTRDQLKWTGVLYARHIDRLRDEFGDIVICPGYVAQFGSKADRWGRVYVPGATSSYSAARKVWAKWKAANEDQLFSWWPAEMERRKVEPILCKDVLDGLSLSRWQAYRKEYLRASGTRNSKARRERSRQEALAETMEEEDQAAEGLLGLGVGATGSTS